MNLQTNQKGFTIVELLIVIVVIAILAAISIVAYTGIQNNARSSAAQAAAASVRDAAEAFNSVHGVYPLTKSEFVNGVPASGATEPALSKLPSDVTFAANFGASNETAPTSPKTVVVTPRGTGGFVVTYWDYKKSGANKTATINVGDITGTAGTPLS